MIDLDLLRVEIARMTRRTKLYRILKEELSLLGYWQNRPRGNPGAGYKASNGGKGRLSQERL